MKHFTWLDEKPEFTEDCILLSAYQVRNNWEFDAWLIEFREGYWQWLTIQGQEYGDINDLKTQKYFTIPILK